MRLPIPLPGPDSADVDFVAVGESSLDYVGVVREWPRPDEKQALEALAVCPGGQAATAAVGVQRLGWRARLFACVGDDEAAQVALALARAAGVDVRAIVRRGTETRRALVLVDRRQATRTVLEHRPAGLEIRAEELDEELVSSGRVLLVDASSVAASVGAARAARDRKVPVLVDIDEAGSRTDELLSLVDIIIVGAAAMGALTGTAQVGLGLRRLATGYPASVAIVTLGAEGAVALCGGREVRATPPVVDVVDSTGAGDAFRAGFAAGWLRQGADAELEEVLACANAVAALNCRAVGAQNGLPAWSDVERYL